MARITTSNEMNADHRIQEAMNKVAEENYRKAVSDNRDCSIPYADTVCGRDCETEHRKNRSKISTILRNIATMLRRDKWTDTSKAR